MEMVMSLINKPKFSERNFGGMLIATWRDWQETGAHYWDQPFHR